MSQNPICTGRNGCTSASGFWTIVNSPGLPVPPSRPPYTHMFISISHQSDGCQRKDSICSITLCHLRTYIFPDQRFSQLTGPCYAMETQRQTELSVKARSGNLSICLPEANHFRPQWSLCVRLWSQLASFCRWSSKSISLLRGRQSETQHTRMHWLIWIIPPTHMFQRIMSSTPFSFLFVSSHATQHKEWL